MRKGLAAIMFLTITVFAGAAQAGMLVNKDKAEYNYAAFWDNLAPPQKGIIRPNEAVRLDHGPCTIELVGKRDNIYVRQDDTIIIKNAIMRNAEDAKKP